MKKYLGYIPAVFFLAFYLFSGLTGVSMAMGMILIWLACFLIAAVLLHKGIIWGGVFGAFPALHMIYRGDSEILIGAVLLLFYGGLSIYLWKKRDADAPAASGKEVLVFFAKIVLSVLVVVASGYAARQMVFDDLKKALSEVSMDLKPAPIPDEPVEFEMVTLGRSETDNSKWLSYITAALKDAKTFEIHCWNEETEWTELALQYGSLKDDDWQYGKIIIGDVTPEFVQMLLGLPKPADIEIYNKMTPFVNVFLDDKFQSCHYGTELYI